MPFDRGGLDSRLKRDYVDPYSSAPHFEGWNGRTWTSEELAAEPVMAAPRTWLLRIGWKRAGPFDANAVPGSRMMSAG